MGVKSISSIPLEPEAIERDKALRLRRFHTVRSPPLRVVGNAVFVAFAWAHYAFILTDPALIVPLQVVTAATLVYVFASWLALVKLYDRVSWVNLGDVFLTADGLVALGTIYATGGEHSLLFFYMTLRAADQSAIGRRRTVFFGGLSVLFYVALMVGIEFIPGRDVEWTVAWAKTGVIAGINLYLVAVASTADRHHRATAEAVRLARSLIGDLEKTSSQLREEKQKAQAASLAKSQFLANMSHEIRTPMNAIIGVNRLQLKTELTSEAADYARTIETSAESLMQLIDDILDLSKVEADKLEIEDVTFSLTSLLEHLAELITPHAEAKGLHFILDGADHVPPWVRGDPGRVQQVLINLVGNAVKFTDQGGVTLVVGRSGEEMTRFQVQDTGIGISTEDRLELFEPFAQATTSIARRFGGTGLGLAISRQLVELMSGTIAIDSMVGIGSTFTVLLPLPEVEEPTAAEVRRKKAPRRGRTFSSGVFLPPAMVPPPGEDSSSGRSQELESQDAWILLADDNDVNRLVMRRQLKALGIACYTVDSGARVLEALAKNSYDLLMLDCQMPDLDGYETARRIRATETDERMPIVAVTAHAMKGDRDRCLAAGMDDYLSKPFREADLWEVLERWLPERLSTAPITDSETDAAISAPEVSASATLAAAVSVPATGWSAVLDRSTIESLQLLEAQSDEEHLMARMIKIFLNRIPVLVAELRQYVEVSDASAVALTIHNLKGTSGTVGAFGLMSLCSEIEVLALGGDLEGSSNLLDQVEVEAQRASDALEEVLAG